jgi:hypothetical protein
MQRASGEGRDAHLPSSTSLELARRMAPRARDVTVVEMHWFFAPGAVPATSSAVLEAARHLVPGLVPTRFGAGDPPPNRVDGDLRKFEAYWSERSAEDWGASAVWIGSGGVLYASLQFPDRRIRPTEGRAVGQLTAHLDLETFASDPDRVAHLLVAVAEKGPAIYACAYVLRGWSVSGSVLSMNVFTSEEAPVPGRGRWVGIPAGAPWLSWYGRAYSAVLEPLIGQWATPTAAGLLVRTGREPQTMDEALANLPNLPDELLAQRRDPRFYATTPTEPAALIPEF